MAPNWPNQEIRKDTRQMSIVRVAKLDRVDNRLFFAPISDEFFLRQ